MKVCRFLPGLITGLFLLSSCQSKTKSSSAEAIAELNLKRGQIISCGPPEKEFGKVGFEISGSENIKKDFDLAIALLHSFEYDEAEKMFAKVIDQDPEIAIAYWGVAMSNYHPLWSPPTGEELEKGARAIKVAQSLDKKSKRETAYIDALATFYKDYKTIDHPTRSRNFESAMEKVHAQFPDDSEAAIFYALTLVSTANPTDKTYTNQKKAASILKNIYQQHPNHPGIIHYLIHSYDNPELAPLALPEARKYASIAPSSAHAQHMPSHIFIRTGLWQEAIQSDKAAGASAKCYAEQTGIKGHWDEELHSLDYLMYSYLQRGDNANAELTRQYLDSIQHVSPVNFKVTYSFAAVPSRYLLENRLWEQAARLEVKPVGFSWDKFPWQNAIVHFTRGMGAARIKDLKSANNEFAILKSLMDTLTVQKDPYKANQVDIQMTALKAWIMLAEGRKDEALRLMTEAADKEDKTQKHPVTPGEVLPAREMLGDMLLKMNQPENALVAYEADLKEHPNRFNALYNAGLAAHKSNQRDKANNYFNQLLAISAPDSQREEIHQAKYYLKNQTIAKSD
jgi:tetratricopeptide (TPR) repeat protein